MKSPKELAKLLPYPADDVYKYSRGRACFISGSKQYPGAAYLSAYASQYVGAGYTEVFTHANNVSILQSLRPSLVVRSFSVFSAKQVLTTENPGALIVGPGIDMEDSMAKSLLLKALRRVDKPILVDGGMLTFLTEPEFANRMNKRAQAGLITILTPHLGEAKRLAEPFNIQATLSPETATSLAAAYGAIVVLKGSTTYISDGNVCVEMTEGTPVLSKAGTGDVLAGVIGGLLSQGVEPMNACELGTYLHAMAGNLAADDFGVISTSAEEVLGYLPDAVLYLEGQLQEEE